MNNYNFIIREDLNPKRYISHEKLLDSHSILEKEYEYLCKSMEEESLKINNKLCNIFSELLYEDKVVGFSTYCFFDEIRSMALSYIYVLPEYRGNGFFINEITTVIISDAKFSILEPSHRLMEILLKNDLAEEFDNLIISPFDLIVSKDSIKSIENKKINEEFIVSNFYDKKVSATIILDTGDEDLPLYYSTLKEIDVKEYGANRQRKKISNKYYGRVRDLIIENINEIMEITSEIKQRVPTVEYKLEDVVGIAPEFSSQLQKFIDDGAITEERAREIQTQITDEYENEYVLAGDLKKRLSYLVFEKDLEKQPEMELDTCIYCGNPIDITDTSCYTCGINLLVQKEISENFNELEEAIMEYALELKQLGFTDDEVDELITEKLNELSEELDLPDDK